MGVPTSSIPCPCQWCRTQRHVKSQCPIFRQQYSHIQPPPPQPGNQWQPCSSAPTNQWQPYPLSPWRLQAHVATVDTSTNSNWLLDSGASHLVTVNLANLSFHKPYDGTNDIVIRDGMGLPISHTGLTTLSIPLHTFSLSNVLCVPTMKRNLISISQFCHSNNISIEFLLSSFFKKDPHMGAILLHSQTKDGVYEWPTVTSKPSPLLSFSAVKTTSSEWHQRLGHPSSSICKHIVSSFQL